MLPGINPITKLLLFHHKKLFWVFFQWSLWVVLVYNPTNFKKRKESTLLILIPGCSNMSKVTEDTLPSFPKAAHLTVLLHNLLLIFYSTKIENLGQKKTFIAFQLFFYRKTEQVHLFVLWSPEFLPMHSFYSNLEFTFEKARIFPGCPVIKIRTLIQQMALPKPTFF